MPSPTALGDTLYREQVVRARTMLPEDKLLEGPRLFARACRLMASAIANPRTSRASFIVI